MACYLRRFPTLDPAARADLEAGLQHSFFDESQRYMPVKYRTLIACRGITLDAAIRQLNHDFVEGLKSGEDQIQPI